MMDELLDKLPVQAKVSASLNWNKNIVEHIFRIETDQLEVCKRKTIRKKKHIIFEQVFLVHQKASGEFDWQELK